MRRICDSGTAGGKLWASEDTARGGGVGWLAWLLYERHVGQDWRGARTAALPLCALLPSRRSGPSNPVSAFALCSALYSALQCSAVLFFLLGFVLPRQQMLLLTLWMQRHFCCPPHCLPIEWIPRPFCDSLHVSTALPLKCQGCVCPHFIVYLWLYSFLGNHWLYQCFAPAVNGEFHRNPSSETDWCLYSSVEMNTVT